MNNKFIWTWFGIIVVSILVVVSFILRTVGDPKVLTPPTYKIGETPAAEIDTLSEKKEAIENNINALEK